MKWIVLLGTALFMAGCCCTQVVSYQQVVPVVEPAMIFRYSQGPIDVTTTTIDYY